MKKIFYKIFFAFIVISYLPLIVIYYFNFLYMDKYIVQNTKEQLIKVSEDISIKDIPLDKIIDSKKNKDIKIAYINFQKSEKESELFNYFNKTEIKANLEKLHTGDYTIRLTSMTDFLNYFLLIKKISNTEFLVIISPTIVPNVVTKMMSSFYLDLSAFIAPILFVLAYIFSKYFSDPIVTLEKISSKISKLDFSSNIDFKYNNELETLGNNLKGMSEKLKNNIDELNNLNLQMKIELKEKEKLINFEKDFMRSIGHELKTPIAIINGYIEALQDDIVSDEEKNNVYSIIYNEGMFLDKLIKNLNTYLKYEFNFSDESYEEFQLKELLEEKLNKYNLDFVKKNIGIKIDIDESKIFIDKYRVSIILNNLFTNAITYVDDRKKIEIEFKDKILRISNSSAYIPEEKFKNIFRPFYKLDSSRNRKYGGAGLGLSIVKNILTSLNLEHSLIFDEEKNYVIFTIKFN